jgi:hypothetical protein
LRLFRSKKRLSVAFAAVGVIATFVTVALASAPSGFTPMTLVTANFDETAHLNGDRVKFQTKDPTDVRVQKIVIDPGGSSGWHHHPGVVIVAVASGAVIVTHSDCSSKTYGPGLPNGAVFTEAGDDPMQASSTTGATNYVTFVAPSADPPVFRIEDDPPACATP